MTRRRAATSLVATLVVGLSLAGCSSVPVGSMTRALAVADAASWTKSAVQATRRVSPGAISVTKADGFLVCRTDTSYFTTSSEWRQISDIAVPAGQQPGAEKSIADAFVANHWTVSREGALTTLVGPSGAKHKGLITVQTAGSSGISVSVISPCYG